MIYIHVPFCRSFCTYCAFYSQNNCGEREMELYRDDLLAEMRTRSQEILATRSLDTLYIGGGTPSVLPFDVLETIVRSIPGGPVGDEFTLEVNPEDIISKGAPYIRALRQLGVNRISMGVQSLNPGVLRWMNRRHSADGARQAYSLLREEGFDNISVDIIYGLPGFEPESLREIALQWHPEHISAYQLGVDEGSALYNLARDGKWSEAPEEDCRSQYELVCRELADAGYGHYEISNWSLEGKRARHNSAYWTRRPYVGLGPAAHSLRTGGAAVAGGDSPEGPVPDIRSWNSEATHGWESALETLTSGEVAEETLMLGLRTSDGVPSKLVRDDVLARMLITGALEFTSPDKVRIPENRWFTSNDIIADII